MMWSLFSIPSAQIATTMIVIAISWVVLLFPSQTHTDLFHTLYNPTISILYFYGAYLSLQAIRLIPTESLIGKVLLGLGAGLACYGVADLIWGYYIFVLGVEIPYPAFSDVFFTLYYIPIAYACISILRLVQTTIKYTHVAEAVIVGLVSAIIMFGYVYKPDVSAGFSDLTTFFDIFYPLADVALLTLAYIGIRVGGGAMRSIILLLTTGMLLEVLADFTFTITTSNETYYNGGLVDLLFVLSAYIFVLTIIAIRKNFARM